MTRKISMLIPILMMAALQHHEAALGAVTTANTAATSITDDIGRTVNIQIPVSRIVCLSPANTEMIYWMGQEHRLIAVSKGSDYPLSAKNLPQAGDFLNPDTELILKIKPDVVISGGGIQKKAIAKLTSLGVPVIVLYPRDFKGIVGNMRLIAGITASGDRTKTLIDRFEARLKTFEKNTSPGIRTYAEIWNQPVMAVGSGSFINEIMNAAGCKNIIRDSKTEYPKASKEEIIRRNPQAVLLLYSPEPDYMKRDYIVNTDAGKNHKVFIFKGKSLDRMMRPGPRIIEAINELKNAINGTSDEK
jgi:iron complex transport system substrate-binding protein